MVEHYPPLLPNHMECSLKVAKATFVTYFAFMGMIPFEPTPTGM